MQCSDLDSARERIRAAYDPALLEAAGHRLVDLLAGHLARVEASRERVLNWHEPAANVEAAREILDAAESLREGDLAERFAELVRTVLARGHNLHDPRYIGHQVPAPVPLAGLFDAIGTVTNQVMAVYEMGPWASAVERALIDALGESIGWRRGEFSGLITNGGSLANLTALLTARTITLGDSGERGLSLSGARPVLMAWTSTRLAGSSA